MSIVLGNGVRGCTPFEYDTYYDRVVYIKCRSCEYEWAIPLDDYKENRPEECPLCKEKSFNAEWLTYNSRLYEYKIFDNLQNLQLIVEVPNMNPQNIVYGDPGLYTITAWAPGVIIPGTEVPDDPDEPDEPDEPVPGVIGDSIVIDAQYTANWSIAHNLNSMFVEVVCNKPDGAVITPVSIDIVDANSVYIKHDNQYGGTCTVTVIADPSIAEVGDTESLIITDGLASTTWLFNHGLNTIHVEASCFDLDDNPVTPDDIVVVDANSIRITWSQPQSGKCIVTVIAAPIIDDPDDPIIDDPDDPTGTICNAFKSTVPVSADSFDNNFIELWEMIVTSPKLIQVYQDNRTNFSYPPGMPQNVSGHNLIIDENKVWYDCGIPDISIPDPGEDGGDGTGGYDATQDCLDAWDNMYSSNTEATSFTESMLLGIEYSTSPFEGAPAKVDVISDDRVDKTVPTTLNGDMTHHRVIWTANGTWHDCGLDDDLVPVPVSPCPYCEECFDVISNRSFTIFAGDGTESIQDIVATYNIRNDKSWWVQAGSPNGIPNGNIAVWRHDTKTVHDCGPYQAYLDGYFDDNPWAEPDDPDPVDPDPILPPEPEPEPVPAVALWVETYVLLDSPLTIRDEGMFYRNMLKVLIHKPKYAWKKTFMHREVIQESMRDYIG